MDKTLHPAGPFLRRRDGEKGTTTLATAYTLAVTAAMTAFVVNTGQILVTRAELQTVADLASKSAAMELSRVYLKTGRGDPLLDALSSAEVAAIVDAANKRALRNSAGGRAIAVNLADVHIGKWENSAGGFRQSLLGADAVEVKARRDESSNGMLDLLIPRLLGLDSVGVRSLAASRLSGIRYVPAGVADFPVGIGKAWFAHHASPCETGKNRITLYPTGTPDSCAGWHTFENEPSSAAELKRILTGLRNRTWSAPAIDVLKTQFIFNGGTISMAFRELQDLYNARKNANGEMSVLIPVYDRDDCSNPQGWMRIVGVARSVITKVDAGTDKRIEARVECDVIKNAESGGTDYGVLASSPDLVH